MGSLQFSGSLWYLLLLPPGLWILWRQYRRGPIGGGRGAWLLALQALALLLLTVSLAGPEWVRRSAEFHNPSILILRDRSGSFAGGEYLGLGEAYAGAERAIAERYRQRGFDVRVADFHERAWPVSGFGGEGGKAGPDGGGSPLTSLAAAADFTDSAGGRNLQAIFLFSDGRTNLDSGKASRNWPVPVYPVALPVTRISEVQPERVEWTREAGGAEGLEISWEPVGPPGGNPAVRLLRGNQVVQVVYTGEMPAGEGGEGMRVARIPWRPSPGAAGAAGAGGAEAWRAVIQPAGGKGNFNPYNDTLPVAASRGGRGGRRIEVIKPLRSLDEKGMADLLHGWDDAAIAMTAPEELASRQLAAGDQVWVEAGMLAARPALLKTLREGPARVVVYARPGSLPGELAGVRLRRLEFSPAAEVRPSRSAADAFPDAVVRLKSVASGNLAAPAAEAPWREAALLSEGGRRGLLMAWFPLSPGKEGLFLALPPMWSLLFDPQADFAVRENLDGLLRAAFRLADRQEGAVKALKPARVYAGLPFDLEFTVPAAPSAGGDAEKGGRGAGGSLELRVGGAGNARASETWPLAGPAGPGVPAGPGGPGPEVFRLEGKVLPEGRWIMELFRGGERLWRDSLASSSKASLELARIGFDRDALRELASQSGGRLIAPDAAGASPAGEVTSLLPDLQGAQVRSEKAQVRRLYNTLWQFLLAVALLAASWFLRKRWDLD